MCHKKNLLFEDNKNCLESNQLVNKISHLEKNEIHTDRFKEDNQEFIKKNNKLILKTQQRFKSERQNVLIEEINKIALNSNDANRMQSVDFIETYSYGMSKDAVSEKEEIKCNNIIKQYKND